MAAGTGFLAGRRRPSEPPAPGRPPACAPPTAASGCEARLRDAELRLLARSAARPEARPSEGDPAAPESPALAACRLSLSEKARQRAIDGCHAFLEMVPFFEHALASSTEADAGQRLSVEQCMPIARWAKMASLGRTACLDAVADGEGAEDLAGKTFEDFEALPLVKECAHRRDVTDAIFEQEARRHGRREVIRTTPNGGLRVYPAWSVPPPSSDGEPRPGAAGF
jgi:hypothetical protein